MSDDFTFEELLADAITIRELGLEKPDINGYLDNYEPEWEIAWEFAPVEDMSEGQINAFIDMLSDMDFEDWPDWDADGFDYWEWWRENYGGG